MRDRPLDAQAQADQQQARFEDDHCLAVRFHDGSERVVAFDRCLAGLHPLLGLSPKVERQDLGQDGFALGRAAQGELVGPALLEISGVDEGFVAQVEQAQQGWRQVDLAGQLGGFPCVDQLGRVDKQRYLVVGDRQVFLARAAGRVVGDEHKDRVIEPRLLACRIEEFADGMVGVFHRTVAAIAGFDIDTPIRVGVRAMVGSGHQL